MLCISEDLLGHCIVIFSESVCMFVSLETRQLIRILSDSSGHLIDRLNWITIGSIKEGMLMAYECQQIDKLHYASIHKYSPNYLQLLHREGYAILK